MFPRTRTTASCLAALVLATGTTHAPAANPGQIYRPDMSAGAADPTGQGPQVWMGGRRTETLGITGTNVPVGTDPVDGNGPGPQPDTAPPSPPRQPPPVTPSLQAKTCVVPTTAVPGHVIAGSAATPQNFPHGAPKVWGIHSNNPIPFALKTNTGEITVVGTLTPGTRVTFRVSVTAGGQMAETEVTCTVTDDRAPTLTYVGTCAAAGDAPAGTVVADSDDFEIRGFSPGENVWTKTNDGYGDWNLDSTTGILSTAQARMRDGLHDLTIHLTRGTETAHARVVCNVREPGPPLRIAREYPFPRLLSNHEVGTRAFQFVLETPRPGMEQQWSMTTGGGIPMTIGPATGVVSLTESVHPEGGLFRFGVRLTVGNEVATLRSYVWFRPDKTHAETATLTGSHDWYVQLHHPNLGWQSYDGFGEVSSDRWFWKRREEGAPYEISADESNAIRETVKTYAQWTITPQYEWVSLVKHAWEKTTTNRNWIGASPAVQLHLSDKHRKPPSGKHVFRVTYRPTPGRPCESVECHGGESTTTVTVHWREEGESVADHHRPVE